MSAMLDTYDMQVLDYSADHDIQMHPSSSDQWFQDEAKMEEDSPAIFKDESDIHLNTGAFTDEKVTIEVDMEPVLDLQNTEYDMLDDHEVHPTEILDVELYDISHTDSPAMLAVDSAQGEIFAPFHTPEQDSAPVESLPTESLNPAPLLDLPSMTPRAREEVPIGEVFAESSQVGSTHTSEPAYETESTVEFVELAAEVTQDSADTSPHTNFHDADAPGPDLEDEEHRYVPDEVQALESEERFVEQPLESELDSLHAPRSTENDSDVHPAVAESDDNVDPNAVPADNISTGDPHEISEGVYIDPPPPVLLSIASDGQFAFSLFNKTSAWNEVTAKDNETQPAANVLLSAFPTLYYEPLSTVFDALRQEESVRTVCSTPEIELVLEAVDLQLIMSEDNMYAREVTLHDLNVLHDVSGIEGLLRMRLYTSTPRFIARYQYLQDEVSRLNLEPAAGDAALETSAEGVPPQEEHYEALGAHAEYETAQTDRGQTSLEGGETEEADTQVLYEGDDTYGHLHNGPEQDRAAESLDEATAPAGSGAHGDANAGQQGVTSEGHDEEANDNHNEDEAAAYHSAPTSESLDNVVRPDDYEERTKDVITLEKLEANLGEKANEFFDPSQDLTEEVDAECEDVDYEEEHSNLPESNQEKPEEYQAQDPQLSIEHEDSEHTEEDRHFAEIPKQDEPSEYQHVENLGDVNASTTDQGQFLELSDPLDPKYEVDYDQASYIDGRDEDHEGDNDDGGANAIYEESVSAHTFEEFSHSEETGSIVEATSDYLLPHPDLEDNEKDWEYDVDGDHEGNITAIWDEDNEEANKSTSNASSTTLSSKASKRGFEEVDSDEEDYENGDNQHWSPAGSPGPKRSRTR
ncbi:hypothetical protein HYPSUDRAFT_52103 [Hypholoma sublateritium FD-334 SS-4]|uniref:Uncharacterized protein n=1 Tax=Hypholoma sublateritium (strain FD-334 SS-4) TaxID=945553 RepID=A0A0D2MSV0_HYPSF|nr:hypothetical protein HYPSUDRAFT_52103 [Hypholoma sublateritium FD-334 SS-4]